MSLVISESDCEVPMIGGPFDGCRIIGRGLPIVLVIGTNSSARLLHRPADEPDGVLCRYVVSFAEGFDRPRYDFATENVLAWDRPVASPEAEPEEPHTHE